MTSAARARATDGPGGDRHRGLYNGLGLPIALGVLYPFVGLLLSPDPCALAM